MGQKTFRALYDWVRHGVNLEIECENGRCAHIGVLDPHACVLWFRLHRWPDAIEAGALRHFRCIKCRATGGAARATMNAVTVVDFFPVNEQRWQALRRRLRG